MKFCHWVAPRGVIGFDQIEICEEFSNKLGPEEGLGEDVHILCHRITVSGAPTIYVRDIITSNSTLPSLWGKKDFLQKKVSISLHHYVLLYIYKTNTLLEWMTI